MYQSTINTTKMQQDIFSIEECMCIYFTTIIQSECVWRNVQREELPQFYHAESEEGIYNYILLNHALPL
jgi:hypothetical protein